MSDNEKQVYEAFRDFCGEIREIVRYFSAGLTAVQASALSGLSRNTINRIYQVLRERIQRKYEAKHPMAGSARNT